jgi:hypothetical protein
LAITENNIGNGFPYIVRFRFFFTQNEFILLAFLKLKKTGFWAKSWYSLKSQTALVQKTTRVLQLPAD